MTRYYFPWICLLFIFPLQAQDADSTAYYNARNLLIAKGHAATDAIIMAADELADEGLFADAKALLNDLSVKAPPDTPRPTDTASGPVSKKPRQSPAWKISGAANYAHFEDVVTILTPEAEDSLNRLKEEPFTVSSKAQLSLQPSMRSIKAIDPSIAVSNQKATAECLVRGAIPAIGEIEAGVKAEKRIANIGSRIMGGDEKTVFLGGKKDSLDMGGGRITLTPGVQHDAGLFAWKTPLTVETIRYRNGRGGYYSYNHFRSIPEISFSSNDMRKNASLRLLGEYKDYFTSRSGGLTRADSFDILRIGPECTGDIWGSRTSASATLGFLYEQYPHRAVPFEMRTLEAETQIRTKLTNRIEALVRARFEGRNERDKGLFAYGKDTTITYYFAGIRLTKDTTLIHSAEASFSLSGYEIDLTPGLRWPATPFTFEARCPLSIRSFSVIESLDSNRLVAPLFIIESRKAMEPELGIDFSGDRASIRASGAWTAEEIPAREYYTQLSSRGWKTRLDCTGRVFHGTFAYAQVEYHFRKYAPYTRNSRASKNATAACGFSVRF
jgi:hypothetical protein